MNGNGVRSAKTGWIAAAGGIPLAMLIGWSFAAGGLVQKVRANGIEINEAKAEAAVLKDRLAEAAVERAELRSTILISLRDIERRLQSIDRKLDEANQ